MSIFVFGKAHLYQSIWRFASFVELEKTAVCSAILGVLHTIGITALFARMPVTYYIVGAAIQFLLILSIRFAYRFVLLERSRRIKELQKTPASRVMLIGAGSAGQMILRDLHSASEVNERVCCIIDDNRNKWGRFIDGVPIVGGRDDILLNAEKYRIEKIFLAIPSATAEQRRDSQRINQVFAKYKPDVVYHAAAHKHVPLMENSPCESIKNNAVGTYKTAYAAMMNGCKRFVLISSDKAVNPTNIMGASKRLCEMIIQSFDRKIREGKADDLTPLHVHTEDTDGSMPTMASLPAEPGTEFVAVRFGNVLGSNGSVIPRFKEQIAKGGPVTVTHPDIIRYFMTIPEAVSLVLQAGTYADGGEIFVLDMGSPVKIDTLARNLIRLSGLKPDVDIEISYTGLRAGEKLYEEKLMSEEGMRTTTNHLIHIGSPIPFDTDEFLQHLQMLMTAAYDVQEDSIRDLTAKVVPTYHPAGEHGSEAKGEAYTQQMKMVTQKCGETAAL